MSNIDSDITNQEMLDNYVDLKKYATDYFYNFTTNQEIFKADGLQLGKILFYIQNIIDNTFIQTATEWGLSILEFEYGIVPKPTDTLEIRRSRLLAKKRGLLPITPYVVRQICNSFVDNTKIVQHFEDYYFELFLENINKGFPNFLQDLVDIIEELKPAHLGVHYELVETTKSNLYIGATTCYAEIITVYPWTSSNIEMQTNVYIPISNVTSLETITVYPKDDDTIFYVKDDNNNYTILEFE